MHLALLAALPVPDEVRSTPKARALDVVLMPEILVPAPAVERAPVRGQSDAPQPRNKVAAMTNKTRVERERNPESHAVPDDLPRQQPAVGATDASPVTAPVASVQANPAETPSTMSRKTSEAVAGRGVKEISAPSFNAAYLRNPAPLYPIIARRNGEQGTVTLKVLVSPEGAPASVSIDKTSGSVHLDNAALETVRSWRFAPARQGTQPVEAWVLVPVVFRLEPVS